MKPPHTVWRWCLLLAVLWLSACATPKTQNHSANANAMWQGRLAVTVFSKPVQAFSAQFELQGNPVQGELVLSSVLGTTLAHMRWSPGSATLTARGEERAFASIQDLAREVTGADLPVTSLFAWLQGVNEAAPGWQVDLQEAASGRIRAQHVEEVQAELKIVVDR